MSNEATDQIHDSACEMGREAKKQIDSAVREGKDFFDHLQDNVVHGAHAVGERARQRPYRAMGLAMGVGACLGAILTKRH